MSAQLQIASLDEAAVSKIRALEGETDTVIMAFEPGKQPAALNEQQIGNLRDLEQELSVTLLAFEV